ASAQAHCGRWAASSRAQIVSPRGNAATQAMASATARSQRSTGTVLPAALRSRPMPRLTQLSRSIEGKVAVVTGAASGMGRAPAHLLADEGAAVAVLDRSPDALQEVADDITGNGGRVAAIDVDLSDAAATDAAIAA